jgi:hypothetical protein
VRARGNTVRMRIYPFLATIAAAAVALSTSACGAPSAATAPAVSQQNPARLPAVAAVNPAGHYKGTVKDSVLGTGTGTADLAASGSIAGGSLAMASGKSAPQMALALSIASTGAMGGTGVTGTPPAGTRACTYGVTSTYNRKTHLWSGSYDAIAGCKNETGTFSLKEQCYYVTASALEQPEVLGLKPC